MHTYNAPLEWHTRKLPHILHQEKLDDAKDRVQEATGLRPTNEKLLKGIRALNIPLRIKDHMRAMFMGKIKCGTFWDKVPGQNERAFCSFCRKKQNTNVVETERHMWLECQNSGQEQAWNMAERAWRRLTNREWPNITLGLIRGAAALTFEDDFSRDSERLRILITMTIWAIRKSKLK